MSSNSTYDPTILIPQTSEEREFATILLEPRGKSDLKNTSTVKKIREELCLWPVEGEDRDIIIYSLDQIYKNLKNMFNKWKEVYDFYDDSPSNKLRIFKEFRQSVEIKFLLGDDDSADKWSELSPGRMKRSGGNIYWAFDWFFYQKCQAIARRA
ncbi:hypothetical protein TWF694_005036 [Orbilia ellipsospora]|uniref:Uncharacterized protein n=1 Tax=Orbilia ellipsospora TaxID=2528407 RepID=A0AAV9WVG7_9PEZI